VTIGSSGLSELSKAHPCSQLADKYLRAATVMLRRAGIWTLVLLTQRQ